MKRSTSKRLRRMSTLAMAAALVAGQASAQDPKPEPQEPEAAPPRAFQGIVLDLGFADWNLSGNEHRFRQYATPPEGFVLRELSYYGPADSAGFGQRLRVLGGGQQDFYLSGGLILGNGLTQFRASRSNSTYSDPTPQVIDESKRQERSWSLRQKLGRGAAATVGYAYSDERAAYEAPKDPRRERTRVWDAQVTAPLAGGRGTVAFADGRYFDRLGVNRETNTRTWTAAYGRSFGPNLDVDASYARAVIEQPGFQDSEVRTWSAKVNLDIDDDTRALFAYRQQKLDLPTVQKAYVRERFQTDLSLSRRFGGWTGQVSYQRTESERVRSDQTFADVFKWNTYEGRLTGRLNSWLRLTVRGKAEDLDGDAPMGTTDPRGLYFDDRRSVDVRLDGGGEKCFGYVAWVYRFLGNEQRGVEIRSKGSTFGFSYQMNEKTELFAEYSGELFDAQSEIAIGPSLDAFFAGTATYVAGFNLAVDPQTHLTVSYSHFVTNNDNPLGLPNGNVRNRGWYAKLQHTTPRGYELGLTIAPWFYTDRVFSTADYNSTMFIITAGGRF